MPLDKQFIDGAWVASGGSETVDVINSTTEEVIASVPAGAASDIDAAVSAARRAQPGWAETSLDDRVKTLQQLSEAVTARMGDLTAAYCREVGAMQESLANLVQVLVPLGNISQFQQIASDYQWEEQVGNSLVVKEPVGVVGAITPWNFPLHQVILKVAPAIVAGNTVVLKPTEVAPTMSYILAECFEEIGLPAGVFNLVCGVGSVVGEALSTHPDVDMVSFTGSTRAGKRVAANGAETVKRIALELGGKSPNVILDDADFEQAVKGGVNQAYLNGGQACIAWTRMLVPSDKMDQAAEIAAAQANSFTLGDPFDADTKMGPMVSKTQQERIRGYIETGVKEGATLVCGGAEQPDHLDKGFFIKPTIFANATNDMTICREEIFGPVVAIIGYSDSDEAIEIANDTPYGLHAGVWSSDPERAKDVARQIRAGQVDINGGGFNPLAPFGGYKQSGCGREAGVMGLEEFLETKSMQL